MSRNGEFLEGLVGDLAQALKKSWSETHDGKTSFENSPIGTPQYNESHNVSPGKGSLTPAGSRVTPLTGDSNNAIYRSNIAGDSLPDCNLIGRHYSLTDQPSVSNNNNCTNNVLGEDIGEGTGQHLIAAPVALPLKCTSIQEVQRVRRLSNPRSSFSSAPLEEPDLQEHGGTTWVTVLAGSSPEHIKPILVLCESLKAVQSKFGLCVVHNSDIDASEIKRMGVETIAFDKEQYPELVKTSLNPGSVLIIFMSLAGKYDLVCYLSPTCMVLENIDNLLNNEEIGRTINNDTCVLLTNSSPAPEIIILRPLMEVEMCIKEFFTVYDNWNDRRKKLTEMRDYDVLETLFGDSWGMVIGEDYCGLLEKSSPLEEHFPYKMADFKLRKPWMLHDGVEMGSLTVRWNYLLLQACRRLNPKEKNT